MRTTIVSLLLAFTAVGVARGQADPGVSRYIIPRADVSAGFQHIQANAPPGSCECFGINGFYVSGDYTLKPWLSLTGAFARGHSDNISELHQNLTLMTYMGGAKVNLGHRLFNPFAQFLVGGAHGSDSYFPTGNTYSTSANSFAFAPGGGLDLNLSRHLTIRAVEASYLHTQFNNGTTNEQNQLSLSAGVVFRMGPWRPRARPTPPPPPAPSTPMALPLPPPPAGFDLTCSATANKVLPGQGIQISANASRGGAGVPVTFAWNASAGQISGSGDHVTLDTSGLSDGAYTVTGTASSTQDRSVIQQCTVSFFVVSPAPPPSPPAPLPPSSEERQRSFRANVKDIYFDLNKSTLRADQLAVVDKDAAFLAANPEMHIQIGGFADQRGSSGYNLALGERRARAVRERLISGGVSADKVEVVTFGRDAQACTAKNESCWQQNRRVGFVLQP